MSYFAHSNEVPEWASQVPQDWGSSWLKWSVGLSTKRPTEEQQETLPYISNEDIESWTGNLLIAEPKPADADSRSFQENDVLFNKLRPYLAKVYHATFDGASSGELLCLRPSQTVEPRFLFYVLVSKGFIDTIDAETFGAKMPRADWEIVGHQPLPLPSIDTQRRIARFLDEKTARIDGLIEKKRALLARLAEKRQALITRAVTKGLNPDAPLKPSGIDWLGDIPKHWSVVSICWFSRVFNGATPPRSRPDFWDGRCPWLSSGEVNKWRITEPSAWISEEAVSETGLALAPSGSVVIGMVGQGRTRGMAARLEIDAYINQNMAGILPGPSLDAAFLHFALVQSYVPIRELGRGGQQDALNCELVGSIRIPFPPWEEQRSIATQLDQHEALDQRRHRLVSKQIDRLREYRQALVTTAVTGQISELR